MNKSSAIIYRDHLKPLESFATNIYNLDLDSLVIVVLPDIGDNLAYKHGLHFCQEVYPYRNQNKV